MFSSLNTTTSDTRRKKIGRDWEPFPIRHSSEARATTGFSSEMTVMTVRRPVARDLMKEVVRRKRVRCERVSRGRIREFWMTPFCNLGYRFDHDTDYFVRRCVSIETLTTREVDLRYMYVIHISVCVCEYTYKLPSRTPRNW